MQRRNLLRSVPVVAISSVAGCIGSYNESGYSFSLTPLTAGKFEDRIAGREDDLIPSPLILDFVSRLLTGDKITLEVSNLELFERATYESFFHYIEEQSFYRIDKTTLETGTVTGLEYKISRSGIQPDPSEGEVLQLTELPYYDQWQLHNSLTLSESGGVIPFSDTFVSGYLDSAYQSNSLLANGIDQEFVKFNDRYIKLEEKGQHSTSMERVRYSATPVAKDSASFGEYITENYAIAAADLSADIREFLGRVAKNGGRYSISRDDEKFESQREILDQIRTRAREFWENTDEDLEFGSHPPGTSHLYIEYEDDGYLFSWHGWAAP
ncbi:hypothetical protein [Natrinema sp. HArc-T2]|uniref:hypothetical protein n=1 Tax=Natrinema sp. HArc-T2 TaxID=3242701 RepID=UPI00359EACB7